MALRRMSGHAWGSSQADSAPRVINIMAWDDIKTESDDDDDNDGIATPNRKTFWKVWAFLTWIGNRRWDIYHKSIKHISKSEHPLLWLYEFVYGKWKTSFSLPWRHTDLHTPRQLCIRVDVCLWYLTIFHIYAPPAISGTNNLIWHADGSAAAAGWLAD